MTEDQATAASLELAQEISRCIPEGTHAAVATMALATALGPGIHVYAHEDGREDILNVLIEVIRQIVRGGRTLQ